MLKRRRVVNVFEQVRASAENSVNSDFTYTEKFLQYIHISRCKKPCEDCVGNNRRIFETENFPKLPAHFGCDCKSEKIVRRVAGTMSERSVNGPDYFLKHFGRLPNYYITKDKAKILGWKPGKDLSRYAPGKMIGGDVYRNDRQYLPEASGRIWYECDVDYAGGKRNALRLFFSNDGLMFFSPNHAQIGEAIFMFVE